RAGLPDTDVFGERACPYTEDFIARFELGHGSADRLNRSGKVRSQNSVFRLTKSKDQPRDTAFQHSTVEKSEGNGVNADENLIFVRGGFFDLLKFQNVIRRPVFAIPDCFHQFSSGRNLASAVVG